MHILKNKAGLCCY